jgi:predicted enzyme related to lactoylglutathione lyase
MGNAFVWYELSTTDVAGAQRFYGDVIGWTTERFPGPEPPYWIVQAGNDGIGGMMAVPREPDPPVRTPGWVGYVDVADVDAIVQKAKALGGTSCVEPHDIPTVGRIAAFADPQGAVLAVIKPEPRGGGGEARPTATEAKPGHVVWHELLTTDPTAALEFYGELLGWQETQAMDMPGSGTYHIYGNGSRDLGGMFTPPTGYPLPPHFLYYVHVSDLDAATARVKKGGGEVWMGPMPIPGGDRITQGKDPQGAVFALHGK